MLPWDGTHLGTITDDNILKRFTVDTFNYWQLEICNVCTTTMYRSIKSFEPCIIDEAKLLFGLPKLGTHSVKYKRKLYILICVKMKDNNTVVRELLLSQIDNSYIDNEVFTQLVRETYVFRDTFAISKTYDSLISCRQMPMFDGTYLQPFSLIESNISENDSCILPGTVMRKWFDEDNMPEHVLQSMLKVRTRLDLQRSIFSIRTGLRCIINRIDPEYTYIEIIVIRRLTSRLCNKITYDMNKTSDNISIVPFRKKMTKTKITRHEKKGFVRKRKDFSLTCQSGLSKSLLNKNIDFVKLKKALSEDVNTLTSAEREKMLKILSVSGCILSDVNASQVQDPGFRLSFRS